MNNHDFIIIGGGSRGLFFAQILEKDLGRKVRAIVDTNTAGAAQTRWFLDKNGIQDVELLDDMDAALEKYPSSEIDGAFIMTPEWTHLEIFRRLTAHGYNIFLEKPVATTPEDAREIAAIAEQYDPVVQIGFVLRYSKFYRRIKKWVDEGRIGKVVNIEMNERLTLQHGCTFKRQWHRKRAYTGGLINEKCSHDIDLMCWILSSQAHPVYLSSSGSIGMCTESKGHTVCSACSDDSCPFRPFYKDHNKYMDGKLYLDSTNAPVEKCVFESDTDVNDSQTVLLEFSNGAQGIFNVVTMSSDAGRDITIHGTNGMIAGHLEKGILTCTDYYTGEVTACDLQGMDAHGGGDHCVVNEFLDCIAAGNRPLAGVRDGVNASLLSFACDESARQHIWIKIDELLV